MIHCHDIVFNDVDGIDGERWDWGEDSDGI